MSAAFGQRFPFERIAAQRPEYSSSSVAPANAASASAWANSDSDWMSIFQPRETGCQAGVQPFLADRERELVIRDDDRRLSRLVVDVHLAHAGRRERLGHEAGRLGVPGDDVDLLPAELGDDHADARSTRADAGADGSTPCMCDSTAIFDRYPGSLATPLISTRPSAISGTSSSKSARISSGSRRERITCGPFVPERTSAITALMRLPCSYRSPSTCSERGKQRLDPPEVDEHVVAVACLLDDPGHDLALAIDVLLVHDRPLGLADALLDDLLGRLSCDPAEVVRGHVGTDDLVGWHLRPVEVEVLVGDQRVLPLSCLLLDLLELGDPRLASVLDETDFDVLGNLDSVDSKLAFPVELDLGMARGIGRFLVRRKQRVLESGDEDAFLDPLLLLDRVNPFDDLLAHVVNPSSIRHVDYFARTIASYGIRSGSESPSVASTTAPSPASTNSPLKRFLPAILSSVRTATCRPRASSKCCGLRRGRSGPGEDTSIVKSWR